MFKNLYMQKSHSYKASLSLLCVIISNCALLSLLLDKNLHHFGKSLALLFALITSFAGVIFFLKSFFQYSCVCAFLSNIIFAITLLWINQTYGSEIELSVIFNLIALCSLLFAFSLGGGLLILQSLAFFYFSSFFAIFNASSTYLCFIVPLGIGFYLAFKMDKSLIKTLNFLNLLYFFSLMFIFKQSLWLVPLWLVFSLITLTHTLRFLSSPMTERLSLLSLLALVVFIQNSNIPISDILQENWIWIFMLVMLSFWLWIKSNWFISIFVFLLICTPIIESFLLQEGFFYLYCWFLFFLVWFQMILRWTIFGFCLLCLFSSLQYLLEIENHSNLGLFFILCCIIFFTTMIIRSKDAY